jgi:hypothetical protein
VLSRDEIARAPDGHVARLRRKLKGVTGESQERAKRATLASTAAGALEAHVCAQITPVRRIERTQLRTDRHRGRYAASHSIKIAEPLFIAEFEPHLVVPAIVELRRARAGVIGPANSSFTCSAPPRISSAASLPSAPPPAAHQLRTVRQPAPRRRSCFVPPTVLLAPVLWRDPLWNTRYLNRAVAALRQPRLLLFGYRRPSAS